MANTRFLWRFYPSYITSVTIFIWYGLAAAELETFEIFAYRGNQVTLNCTLTDSIPLWFWKSTLITDHGTPISSELDRISLDNKGNVIIDNAQLNDTGTYSCIVTKGKVQLFELTVGAVPEPPEIVTNVDAEKRVWVNEKEVVNLTCVSRGGHPAPELFWSAREINRSSETVKTNMSDGTITVIATSSVSGIRTNDRVHFTCTAAWFSSRQSTYIILFLRFRPSDPVIKGSLTVPENSSTTLQCTSSGCRPAGNISWSFAGSPYATKTNLIHDESADTYNMSSKYITEALSRADNRKNIVCLVGHVTVETPLVKQASFDVQFAAKKIELTGNLPVVANGRNKLTLKCKTSSANPVANITWSGASVFKVLNDSKGTGQHNGLTREQIVTITPRRTMDGDLISCTAEHFLQTSSQKPSQTIKLDLQYNPVVTILERNHTIFNEGDLYQQLSCSASSKPSCRFSWYHGYTKVAESSTVENTNTFNYTIKAVNRTHFGEYRCKANNSVPPMGQESLTVQIRFPPGALSLTGNKQVVANGTNKLILKCSTDSAFPKASVYWQHQSANLTEGASETHSPGQYGGFETLGKLELLPTRKMDGDIISCFGSNTRNLLDPVTEQVALNLSFHTIFSVDEELNATEGESGVVLNCSADSKPPSFFQWFKVRGSKILTTGSGNLARNWLTHIINNINRTHAGYYRCWADNQIGTPEYTNNILRLNVYYPPDVSVQVRNATIHDSEVHLLCSALGVPSVYSYSEWQQSWPGNSAVLRRYSSSANLTLRNLSYEDTGVYSCRASNGVTQWGKTNEFMKGSGFLLIKTFPIIVSPDISNGHLHKVPARLNKTFSATIQFYSNYDSVEEPDVVMFDSNNRSVNDCVVERNQSDIKLRVHNQLVSTVGINVTVTYTLTNEIEFGMFYVDIKNDIGSAVVPMEIKPEGPPCPPVDPFVTDVKERTIMLFWKSCFHGGFAQTFVIEYSTDNKTWMNGTSRFGGLSKSPKVFNATIGSLQPRTSYYIRLYSYNAEGSSSYTLLLEAVTQPEEQLEPFPVGALGGAVGAAAFIIIIVFLVVMWKRRVDAKRTDDDDKKTTLTPKRQEASGDHDDTSGKKFCISFKCGA